MQRVDIPKAFLVGMLPTTPILRVVALRLLQERIGERMDTPPNAITEAVVEERLRPAGASRELCNSVQALFQRCNQARYAPVKSSEELSAVIPRLEQTLRELEQWEPKNV